jgi:glycosyltransferase involved in cell wall biosynthesis
MRIGINRSPSSIWYGGIFNYETVLLDALCEIAKTLPDELVYLSYRPDALADLVHTGELRYRTLPVVPLYAPPEAPQQQPPEYYIAKRPTQPRPFLDINGTNFDASGEKLFRRASLDWLFVMSPFMHGFSLRMPFVMPIFDLNHKINPQFPEVSANGETNYRDYLYNNACRYATLIIVDSETGKSDVLRYYGHLIDADRIRILPMYAPMARKTPPSADELARVRAKYKLPDRYFFYPAQFWPHKNHELIIRAIKAVADETGERFPVVLCGSYADPFRAENIKRLEALAKELNVADCVRYLGVVPEEDMGPLFTMSVALVAPTYFGPANIPPLEAWYNGRPVIMCNLPGIREQIGDAGLLVDPKAPQDLAGAMRKLWQDEALCVDLARRGQQKLAAYGWEDYVARVTGILVEASERVRSGRTPNYPPA